MKTKFIIAALAVILAVLLGMLIVKRGKGSDTSPSAPTPTAEEMQQPAQTAMPNSSFNNDPSGPAEQPIPTSQPHTTKTMDEVWDMVKNVLAAAEDFYDVYGLQTQYVSKNGFLFENASGDYVTPAKLLELTELREEYGEENVWILYLRPNAFDKQAAEQPNDANTSAPSEEELSIFAAYETGEGFAIVGQKTEIILPKAQLDEILAGYKWDHGQILRYNTEDEQMKQILALLADGGDLDVRHLARDDKYASAVVSPKDNRLLVKEYALVNQNGEWSISLSDIEKKDRKFSVITRALPDMNLNMVPRYQLAADLIYMRTDFADLLTALRKSGSLYESDGEPSFAAGDNDFVYLEFPSDLKLLGYFNNDEKQWVMYPVLHYADAEALMKQHARHSDPPYFYIKEN